MYLVKTYWWLKALYPSFVWNMNRGERTIYLTFDDGPHPTATPFVLNELKKYNAKATFFCIGKNVIEYPEIYKRIIDEGHAIGNHTYNHLNGWNTNNDSYLQNIDKAIEHIKSNLFRPPYGRIKTTQSKQLKTTHPNFKIIMWDVLSADFDTNISAEQCYKNVIKNTLPGSIIVFHDSTKALDKMTNTLPKVLQYFSNKNFTFKAISQ